MLTILLYFLPQECSHICLFKNKDFFKTKNYKYFKLISYRNNKTQWPTCNMLAHCTIWFFFYLNFCIEKAIFAEYIEPVKKFISILHIIMLSSCFFYLCAGLCLNMKTALFLMKLSSITAGTSMGHFTPKNHSAKYLLRP